MNRAHFYVAPWAVVKAQQETRGPNEPMCCHDALVSVEALDATPATLVLAHVHWGSHWAARERFEAQPEVIALGEPWEPVPLAAIPVLEAFRVTHGAVRAARVGPVATNLARPEWDASAPIDAAHTVSAAVRKAHPLHAHELF